jgi:hypothetical protein
VLGVKADHQKLKEASPEVMQKTAMLPIFALLNQ